MRLLGRIDDRDPWRHLPAWLSSRLRMRLASRSSPYRGYLVYDSLDRVPAAVWSDDSLLVERFVPEREDGVYRLRRCHFLGSAMSNIVFRSREPVAMGRTLYDPQRVDPPDEILEIRHRLGLDFGRLDYAMVDGRVALFDINKTPSARQTPRTMGIARELASGLAAFL
jgi:hypothetical protein